MSGHYALKHLTVLSFVALAVQMSMCDLTTLVVLGVSLLLALGKDKEHCSHTLLALTAFIDNSTEILLVPLISIVIPAIVNVTRLVLPLSYAGFASHCLPQCV